MKQFIKRKWLLHIVLLLLLVASIFVCFLLGFRITYAPSLENKWDAISGVADWFSVIVSILSVVASFMAIRYAIQVADKQNKVSLFEKRMELYYFLGLSQIFLNTLNDIKSREDIQLRFLTSFYEIQIDNASNIEYLARTKYIFLTKKINQAQFLITDFDSEIAAYIIELIYALNAVVNEAFEKGEIQLPNENVDKAKALADDKRYYKLIENLTNDLTLK